MIQAQKYGLGADAEEKLELTPEEIKMGQTIKVRRLPSPFLHLPKSPPLVIPFQ